MKKKLCEETFNGFANEIESLTGKIELKIYHLLLHLLSWCFIYTNIDLLLSKVDRFKHLYLSAFNIGRYIQMI